jgi:alpha-1,6-mannosyltransferase
MSLKTLHLTNSWHETSGGIATFYRALMQEANRRGHSVRLVVPEKRDWVEEVGALGRIYYIKAPPAFLNSRYRTIYPMQFLSASSRLQRILTSERPDLVEICDKYTLNYLAALLRRQLLPALDFRPVVIGLSCERMDDNFRSYVGKVPLAAQFCSAYMKWLYFPFFDHHIANSDYTATELQLAARGQLVTRSTWVRHMGVDLRQMSPLRRSLDRRRRLLQTVGAPAEAVLLLYVGRLVPEKNLVLLFDLLAHLVQSSAREIRLLVVGDGIERGRWGQECGQRFPGRVLFLGHIKDRDVLADTYANADVFVHPNPQEPFGIAPLEAMASGLPLVAPNRGGVTSYANPENAWTVAPTVEYFAAAVNEVMANRTVREEKTARALRTALEYRWEKVAASFLDLYAELCRSLREERAALSVPAFRSTPAIGVEGAILRAAAVLAEKTFAAGASAFRLPQRRLGGKVGQCSTPS